MGNVETASEYEKDAYFVFMVKCSYFERILGSNMYSIVVAKGNLLYA